MNKFLRKNNKKLLAIFGVFLMIAFVVQTRYNPSGNNRASVVIGRIGSDQVTEGDLETAHNQWRLLSQALVVEYPPQSGEYHSFLSLEFEPSQTIDQDPKLYALLLKEADRLGTAVTDQEVQDFLTNPQLDIQMSSGSVARYDQLQSVDPDYAADVREATAAFLRVHQASGRAMDLCKFSRPLKDFALAEDHQNISVRLVTFDAHQSNGKIPVPTPQDLQKQFEQFANVAPSSTASENNPLGLGYKIPDQIRLDTIAVTRQDLKEAVSKSKSEYDWKVLEWGYYLKHQADFPATQPVAPPASAMMTVPATQPTPTTKPFDQVRAQIMDKVMGQDVDDLSDRVQKSIATTLAQDWATYHAANPSTQPTTAPTAIVASTSTSQPGLSSLAVPYDSYAYLTALAAKVQKDFDVLPETAAYNKPLSSTDLGKLPGIGTAHAQGGSTLFTDAASDPALSVFQPSTPLQSEDGSVYIFRIAQRIPAHAPASISEVSETVAADWLKAEEYQAALSQANALHDAAAKTSLMSAAAAAGRLVVTTAPFSAGLAKASDAVTGVPLKGEDLTVFRQKCRSILDAAARHEPPVAVVEAPNESKVLTIELADVTPDWPKGEKYVAEAQVTQELMSEFARPLETQWFTLPSVEARLGYTDTQKNKDAG